MTTPRSTADTLASAGPWSAAAPRAVLLLGSDAGPQDARCAQQQRAHCEAAGWDVVLVPVPPVPAAPRILVGGPHAADRQTALARIARVAADVVHDVDRLDPDVVEVHGLPDHLVVEVLDRLALLGVRHRFHLARSAARRSRAALLALAEALLLADEVVVADDADAEVLATVAGPRGPLRLAHDVGVPQRPPTCTPGPVGAGPGVAVLVRATAALDPRGSLAAWGEQTLDASRVEVHAVGETVTAADLDRVTAPFTVLVDAGWQPVPRFLERLLATHSTLPGAGHAVAGVLCGGEVPTGVERHVRLLGTPTTSTSRLVDGGAYSWQALDAGPVSLPTDTLRRHVGRAGPWSVLDLGHAERDALTVHRVGAVRCRRSRVSLTDVRAQQVVRGREMLDLALRRDDADVWNWLSAQPAVHALTAWTRQRPAVQAMLALFADRPVTELREGRWLSGVLLHCVDNALAGDLAAHYSLGVLAGMALRRSEVANRPVTIGFSAGDPDGPALAAELAGEPGIRAVACCADTASAEEFSAQVVGDLAGRDLDPESVDIEVRVTDVPVWAHRDVDLLLPASAPAEWRSGDPVPMWSLPVPVWSAVLRRP